MKPKPNAKKRAVIYTRVSRVGDRSGDSYISPEVQREASKAKAAAEGYEVIEVIHEEDVSGGDADPDGAAASAQHTPCMRYARTRNRAAAIAVAASGSAASFSRSAAKP